MIGTDEGVDNVINNLGDYDFGLKSNHKVMDYLSCGIHVNYEIKKLDDKLENKSAI
jgi:hypothetical protein